MYWFTVLGISFVVVSYLWLSQKKAPTQIGKQSISHPPPVDAISLEEARIFINGIARDSALFAVTLADGIEKVPVSLGPVTCEFFRRYRSLGLIDGTFKIDAGEIRPSQYIAGFLSIGHYEDWDIVQRPGQDDVFVAEGSETSEADMEKYPTVYHFLFHEMNQ
jgi:hypothetical protein